ncbi:TPA: hypothetical protein LOL43_004768, partial [Salmonella enterica subsp. enterica serovar Infantis]|nr:hypothetical protein [Salmonella enterica subsp. enterica serovar Infantis]EHC6415150.1 hypothetical protein [Salmonella enterica]EHC4655625.1 hypothetical protein [Salmonella enterica subsp. enterica serovar Infantis]EHJ2543445.1 hypothetical protein [Salmonella enterica]EIT9281078.1 hypothetical protein [Salmonella enterica subsp. enterica serovar Infantis]
MKKFKKKPYIFLSSILLSQSALSVDINSSIGSAGSDGESGKTNMSTSTGQAGTTGQRGSNGGRGQGTTVDTYGHPGGDPSSGQQGYADGTGGNG